MDQRDTYWDPIQSAAQNLADSISGSADSRDWNAVNEKLRLLIQLMDARERYGQLIEERERSAERSPIVAEIDQVHTDMDDMHAEMSNMHTEMNKMEEKLTNFLKRGNFWARMIPLFLVAVALVFYPLYGMVTRMAPQDLVQYLTPISGLAGAIIGYWFGRQGEGS